MRENVKSMQVYFFDMNTDGDIRRVEIKKFGKEMKCHEK